MGESSTPGFDWVELLVKAGQLVGLSPVRTRWKLLRFKDSLAARAARARTRAGHLSYEHQVCRSCGAVVDGGDKRCPRCQAPMRSRAGHVFARLGLVVPAALSFSTALAVAFVAIYLRMMLAEPGGGLLSFDSGTLLRFGALWPPALSSEPWRLGTAMFLHIGLMHLGFNTIALMQIGPAIEELHGRFAMLAFFLVTGLVANVATVTFGLAGLQAGASGGLMGLCGIAAGWGQLQGTPGGRELRNRMLQWAAYTVLFGLVVHADNVAHIAGFACGAALGWIVRPRFLERIARSPLAAPLGALPMLGALALAVLAFSGIGVVPSARAYARIDPQAAPTYERRFGPACELLAKGKPDEALAQLRSEKAFASIKAEVLARSCELLARQRASCAKISAGDFSEFLGNGITAEQRTGLEARLREVCAREAADRANPP